MNTIKLIKEILDGKMLYPGKLNEIPHEGASQITLYGLSNNFHHYGSLENFLRLTDKDVLDWSVYEPPVRFNDLKVGDKFKFNQENATVIKVTGTEKYYGYTFCGTVTRVWDNPLIIRV